MGNNIENKRRASIKNIMVLITRTYSDNSAQAKSVKTGLKKLNANQLDSLFCLILSSN